MRHEKSRTVFPSGSQLVEKLQERFGEGVKPSPFLIIYGGMYGENGFFSGASAEKKAFPPRFLLNSQWSPAAIKVSRSLAHWPRSPLDAPLARGSFGPGNS